MKKIILYLLLISSLANGQSVNKKLIQHMMMTSAPSAQVPDLSSLPAITGTERQISTLSGSNGTWTNTPTSYTYQWYRDGSPIGSATANTYLLTADDVGTEITFGVVAINASGSSTEAISDATGEIESIYEDIPSAPFSSGYNRAMTGLTIAGQLRNSDVGGGTDGVDIVLTTDFTGGLSINAMNGTTTPYRLTNASLITVGSASKGFANIGSNDRWEFYGKDAATPLLVTNTGTGVGWDWLGKAAGKHDITIQNSIVKSGGVALKMNDGTNPYGDVVIRYVRSFNSGTEAQYFGSTNAVTNGFISLLVEHCFAYASGWDNGQWSHTDDFILRKSTFIGGATLNSSGQDHLMQLVDINGTIDDSIFDGGRFFNISTHGITITNCIFRITDTSELGFIGRTDNLSYYPSSRHNGLPILFQNCYIIDDSGSSSGALVQVAERIADVEFRDCVFDTTKSTLYQDSRVVGFTNTLIGTLTTNGNSIAAITMSTIPDVTEANYETHGLATDSFTLNLGIGYRTKD